jgi:hypothetical protein
MRKHRARDAAGLVEGEAELLKRCGCATRAELVDRIIRLDLALVTRHARGLEIVLRLLESDSQNGDWENVFSDDTRT